MKEPILSGPGCYSNYRVITIKPGALFPTLFVRLFSPTIMDHRPKPFAWLPPAQALPSHSESVVLPEIKAGLGQDVPVCVTQIREQPGSLKPCSWA